MDQGKVEVKPRFNLQKVMKRALYYLAYLGAAVLSKLITSITS